MPPAERIRRGVVPKRGMVSTGVDGGTLLSGDGKMKAGKLRVKRAGILFDQ
jgi:hypothetical protein